MCLHPAFGVVATGSLGYFDVMYRISILMPKRSVVDSEHEVEGYMPTVSAPKP